MNLFLRTFLFTVLFGFLINGFFIEESVGNNRIFCLQASAAFLFLTYVFFRWKKKSSPDFFILVPSIIFLTNGIYIALNHLPAGDIPFIKNYIKVYFSLNLLIIFLSVLKDPKNNFNISLISILSFASLITFRYNILNSSLLVFLIYLLFYHYLKTKTNLISDSYDIGSLVLSFLFLVSGLYSGGFYNIDGINSSIYFISGALAFIYFRKFMNYKNMITTLNSYILLYLLQISFILVLILASPSFQFFKTYFANNIAGYHVSNIGGLLVSSFPALSIFLFLNKKRNKLLLYLPLLISLIILYFSHSRSSTIAIFLSAFLSFLFLSKQSFSKKYYLYLSGIVILFIAVFFLKQFLGIGKSTDTSSLYVRFIIWEYYIDRILTFSPFLGFGPSNEFHLSLLPIDHLQNHIKQEISAYMHEFAANPHAHNLYVQFFFMSGVLGLAGLLFLLIKPIVNFFKLRRKLPLHFFTVSGIISFAAHGFFEYTLIDGWYFFSFVLYILVLLPKQRQPSREKKMSNVLLFTFLIILSFLAFLNNHQLKLKSDILSVLKNRVIFNNFRNLKLVSLEGLTEDHEKKIEAIQSKQFLYYRNLEVDLIVAEYYYQSLQSSKVARRTSVLKLNQCLSTFPQSAFCYSRLADIMEEQSSQDVYNQRSQQYDPFHVLFKF